ncbi:Transport protein SEC31 [Gossypium australe]|uniref:Transport protein SEC31 n=1 Tax=Gossypium australe TaxID=47621 RepID=A0A5B6VKU0_9ROSI|nr:Transport protein SEC31 [Gossypium australe]
MEMEMKNHSIGDISREKHSNKWKERNAIKNLECPIELCDGDKDIGSVSVRKMGKCKGCGKLGRMLPRDGPVNAYYSSLLCSPVVSVWDCIVRKMRYSYRPEWV